MRISKGSLEGSERLLGLSGACLSSHQGLIGVGLFRGGLRNGGGGLSFELSGGDEVGLLLVLQSPNAVVAAHELILSLSG